MSCCIAQICRAEHRTSTCGRECVVRFEGLHLGRLLGHLVRHTHLAVTTAADEGVALRRPEHRLQHSTRIRRDRRRIRGGRIGRGIHKAEGGQVAAEEARGAAKLVGGGARTLGDLRFHFVALDEDALACRLKPHSLPSFIVGSSDNGADDAVEAGVGQPVQLHLGRGGGGVIDDKATTRR